MVESYVDIVRHMHYTYIWWFECHMTIARLYMSIKNVYVHSLGD